MVFRFGVIRKINDRKSISVNVFYKVVSSASCYRSDPKNDVSVFLGVKIQMKLDERGHLKNTPANSFGDFLAFFRGVVDKIFQGLFEVLFEIKVLCLHFIKIEKIQIVPLVNSDC